MKTTTVGLGTLLAGCSSDQDGSGNTKGDKNKKFSGVSIDYWDIMNVQSQTSREKVQQLIENFQNRTGARVQLNMSGYDQMSGQKWVQAWQNENYPVAFNHEDFYFGRIIKTGYIKPFDEYKDQIDDAAIDGMQWAMDQKKNAYRFWDIPGESGVINIPHASGVRNPLTVRTDKLKQAGYSPDDIPDTGDAVKDWEKLMEIAKDVQKNSDVRYGFHAHAAWPDYNDNMAPWMSAQNAGGSRYISEDGTKAYPSDLWTPWLKRFVDTQHKYGVSGPKTASISDEEVATQMYAGDTAMSNVETLNYPTFLKRAPDVLKNGNLKILPYPGGNSGTSGHLGFHDSGLNKKPSNADSKRWDRKLSVGQELINTLLSEDFQTGYPDMVGWMGIRQDQWDKTKATHNEQTGFIETNRKMMTNAKVTWPYHRFSNQIIFRTIAPYVQNATKQKISPKEAMSKARKESNGHIQSAIDELGEPGTWSIER